MHGAAYGSETMTDDKARASDKGGTRSILHEPSFSNPFVASVPMLLRLTAAVILGASMASCDGGLEVPTEEPAGTIAGSITYLNPSTAWPPDSTIFDLRFVAMRFVPADTADFLQLNRMEISERLRSRVEHDSFVIEDAKPGAFPYSGVALQFSSDIFDWKPVGLYADNDGVFTVRRGETTYVSVVVDFENLPIFPPQ